MLPSGRLGHVSWGGRISGPDSLQLYTARTHSGFTLVQVSAESGSQRVHPARCLTPSLLTEEILDKGSPTHFPPAPMPIAPNTSAWVELTHTHHWHKAWPR